MKNSVIEAAYEMYLLQMGIEYEREYQLPGTKHYRYDFYLPETNTLVELDDDNHYRGGMYEDVHRVDLIKNELASEFDYNLERIDVRRETNYLFNLRMHILGGYKKKLKSTIKHDAERLSKCHDWFIDYVNKVGLDEYLNRPIIRRK